MTNLPFKSSPLSWQADARAMIARGGDEWVAAAVKVGLADTEEEAWELYEDDTGDVTDTLVDMVTHYWRCNGGYVIRRACKGESEVIFADDPRLDEDTSE